MAPHEPKGPVEALREFIAAVDTRVPHAERADETAIAEQLAKFFRDQGWVAAAAQ